jgi:hypothetical protein
MKKLIYVLLIAFLVLAVPLFIRFHFYDSLPIGEQAYYHLRAAETSANDNLAFYEKPFFKTPYHYLIGYVNPVILQFILGLLSAGLFYLIANKFGFKKEKFYMIVVLALSPIFIHTFTVISPHSLAVFLLLLGFWLFAQENKILSAISIIPFALASYNIFNSLLMLLALGSYYIVKREKIYLVVAAAVLATINIIFMNPFLISYQILEKTSFVVQLLSDFGGFLGFSVFALILFAAGFVSYGRKKLYAYPLLLFFIIMFFIKPETTIYLNFLVSFFAGIGLFRLANMKWKVELIRDLIIVILICGLMFSAVSYVKSLSSSMPDREFKESMDWLSRNRQGIVFTHYSNGFIIETLGNKKVMMDSMSKYGPKFEELLNDSNTALNSRNLEITEKIFKKYDISYIVIDKKMKENIWKGKEDGLLFLLTNWQVFEKIHSNGVEIWRYRNEPIS